MQQQHQPLLPSSRSVDSEQPLHCVFAFTTTLLAVLWLFVTAPSSVTTSTVRTSTIMASAAVTASEYAAAAKLAAATPKPTDKTFRYGTAGFRSLASTLDSTFLRVGMLAALRGQNVKQVGG